MDKIIFHLLLAANDNKTESQSDQSNYKAI